MPNDRICLTIGDPTGIGPEITAKFLSRNLVSNLIVIGDIAGLRETADWLEVTLPENGVDYINVAAAGKLPGRAAYDAIEKAVALIAEEKASQLVTGPVSKENLLAAGIEYPGHTEILEELANRFWPTQNWQADMLFVHSTFRMLLLTRHIPLSQVSYALSSEGVCRSLDNLTAYLNAEGIEKPKLAVMGMNPHGGEIGGTEEQLVLEPVIEKINASKKADCFGPMAADALFRGFDPNNILYDAYVACYHDQGLIPFKMIAGYEAVNVTIGLPFVRTSVSHGTAPDIVGKGVADPRSLQAAFGLLKTVVTV